jgi:hypothetical protein
MNLNTYYQHFSNIQMILSKLWCVLHDFNIHICVYLPIGTRWCYFNCHSIKRREKPSMSISCLSCVKANVSSQRKVLVLLMEKLVMHWIFVVHGSKGKLGKEFPAQNHNHIPAEWQISFSKMRFIPSIKLC